VKRANPLFPWIVALIVQGNGRGPQIYTEGGGRARYARDFECGGTSQGGEQTARRGTERGGARGLCQIFRRRISGTNKPSGPGLRVQFGVAGGARGAPTRSQTSLGAYFTTATRATSYLLRGAGAGARGLGLVRAEATPHRDDTCGGSCHWRGTEETRGWATMGGAPATGCNPEGFPRSFGVHPTTQPRSSGALVGAGSARPRARSPAEPSGGGKTTTRSPAGSH